MATATPHPTILDPYLPSGIPRLVVFPTPSTAKTVLAIDLDDSTSEYYATYPGSIVDLTFTGIGNLAGNVRNTGQELTTVPGLHKAQKQVASPHRANPSDRFYKQSMDIYGIGDVRSTAVAGATLFIPAAIGSVSLFGWEPWSTIPAVVVSLGSFLGLHLDGMRRDRNDKKSRTEYDAALKAEDKIVSLAALPTDLVPTIHKIHGSLSTLRSYGLSTDDYHAETAQVLETCIRAVLAKRHHNTELSELDKILDGVDQEDIRNDHELFRTNNHRNQHLASRNQAETRANRAFQRLRDLADTTGREARTAKAKVAAAAHLSKKPDAK